jgi:hypothetical protein
MNNARIIAVWIFIIGIYIGVPLKIGTVPIPAFLAGASGIFLLALNASQIQRHHGWLLLGLGLLTLPGLVLNFGDGAEIPRLKGAVQLLYSVVIGFGLFLELRGWGKERVAKLFYILLLLIVIGCFLEVFTNFSEISNYVRHLIFDQNSLYDYGGPLDGDFRDNLLYGRLRPKLFSTEPSYVAIFFLLSMTIWITLTKPALTSLGKYFVFALAGMYLMRSPIVLLTACVPALNFLLLRDGWDISTTAAQASSFKRLVGMVLYSSALVIALLATWHGMKIYNSPTVSKPIVTVDRFALILNGEDDSVKGRLVAPPLIAYDVLSSSPWFGVGLEAKVKLNQPVLHVFQQLGMQLNIVDNDKLGYFVTNDFWLHWIYWGLLGGSMVIFLIYKLMRLIGVNHPLYCFVVIVMFMQTMGGYVTPRFWFVSFLIMLLGTLHSKYRDGRETLEHTSDAQK